MAAIAFTGMDEVMGFPVSWAFGYSPYRPGRPADAAATTGVSAGKSASAPSRHGSTFGMIGANGSAAYADVDSGLAAAILRNGPPAAGLTAAARIDRLIAETKGRK